MKESPRVLYTARAGGDKLSAVTYREGDPYRDLVKFLGALRLLSGPIRCHEVEAERGGPGHPQGRTVPRALQWRSASLPTASQRRTARWDP